MLTKCQGLNSQSRTLTFICRVIPGSKAGHCVTQRRSSRLWLHSAKMFGRSGRVGCACYATMQGWLHGWTRGTAAMPIPASLDRRTHRIETPPALSSVPSVTQPSNNSPAPWSHMARLWELLRHCMLDAGAFCKYLRWLSTTLTSVSA